VSGGLVRASLRLGRVGLGLALLCLPWALWAQGAPAGRDGAVAGADSSAWLVRIQQAAADTSYQGTLMFSAGGVVSSSRIEHYCDGRQRYERLEVLDGRARVQYRHNERMVTVWPAARTALVEQRGPLDEFPALPASATTRAAEHYELKSVGQDRVAGHDVEVLMAKPRDKHRYAQRLWAERETGLLLRSDVLGPAGEVLESSAFTDVKLGARPQPDNVLKPMKKLDGLRVVQGQVQRVPLEAEGWTVARPVPGFQLVSCTKRPLDATADSTASVPVLQSVFSDGMAHVSVFIEPYDAQRHKQAMGTSLGATHTLMKRHGDWWVTVVGEVPMATMQLFESMLERKR
jgi:sigma-E factor negative regulatory protein RseB